MPTLRVLLLGALDLRCDDQPLPKPPTFKPRWLLAYLATHGKQPQPRERCSASSRRLARTGKSRQGRRASPEERIARLLIDESEADLLEADLRGLRDLGGL